jgi:recombination protein RecA
MPRAATARRQLHSTADEAQAMTIDQIEKAINKKWPGSMIRASDDQLRIVRLPSGILSLDVALGGGFARNRHHELFGGYSVGKTATAYRTIAQTQRDGGRGGFVDAEGSFDPDFAASLGVDVDKLVFHRQETANRVINVMEALLRSRALDVLCLDSIAALLPKSEVDADMEDGNYGTAQAKLMSQALRRLTAANSRTAILYINQTREAVGASMFAKRTITSGGKAMAFYAGTRLELVRTENLKKTTKIIDHSKGETKTAQVVSGHRVLLRVEKDKTGGAKQSTETTVVFDYDLGDFDPIEDLIYLGRKFSLIKKSTGHQWWLPEYEDEKQQGRSRFKKWLRRNRAVAEELEEAIRAAAAAESEDDDDDLDEDE